MTDKHKVARDILSDITVHMKYARYLPEKERRETWSEIVDRNKAMHQKKYPELAEMYWSGSFDQTCPNCSGKRVVYQADWEALGQRYFWRS